MHMDSQVFRSILLIVQHSISFFGVFIILIGVLSALLNFLRNAYQGRLSGNGVGINDIRLNLGRTLILGLEFIVAADLIGTTTTPDYYSVGLLAIIVLIRTLLTYSINREIMLLGSAKE